jgi:hypothetical protein
VVFALSAIGSSRVKARTLGVGITGRTAREQRNGGTWATLDLAPEIEGMSGRQLRMRMVTFEPGGVLSPIHDHKQTRHRLHIARNVTDHRGGAATDYGPRVGWPEDRKHHTLA